MKDRNYIVYKLTNIVNNKIYIGGTSDKLDDRFHQHVLKSNAGSNYPLHKAIREYGEDAFTRVVLEECESLQQLNEREAYWIATLSASNSEIGYNNKVGGGIRLQSLESRRKIGNAHKGKVSEKRMPILQYSADGNFIKEYPSFTAAIQESKVGNSCILRSLAKGYTKPSKKNPYIWIYKETFQEIPLKVNPEDYFSDMDYKPQMSEQCKSKRKDFDGSVFKFATPVAQYSLDGELIAKYFSISEACRQTGVSVAAIKAFLKNPDHYNTIKRKDRTKYIWKACDKNDPDVFKTEDEIRALSAKKNSHIVRGYDSEGNLVKEYSGVRAFEKAEHVDRRTVQLYILEDAPYKGIYWEIN